MLWSVVATLQEESVASILSVVDVTLSSLVNVCDVV